MSDQSQETSGSPCIIKVVICHVLKYEGLCVTIRAMIITIRVDMEDSNP